MSVVGFEIRPDLIERLLALYCDWREGSAADAYAAQISSITPLAPATR
jgi:hypothetical protein